MVLLCLRHLPWLRPADQILSQLLIISDLEIHPLLLLWQAVLGGATECHRAQRGGASWHLHREWREWWNLCLQGDRGQHRTPGWAGIWRPATGG